MLNLFEGWTVGNYLSLLSIIPAMIGGFSALGKLALSVKTKRAEFLLQLNSTIRSDKELAEIAYMIDYNREWYSDEFHNKSGLEFSVDRYLSYIDYICYLKRLRHFSKKELMFFQYRITRLLKSPSVRNYLWNLYHFSNKNQVCCSFMNLIEYGFKTGLIDKLEFDDSTSNAYEKRLLF